MNPTTLQHLGQQPGRARLGAFVPCCRPRVAASHRGSWRVAVAAPSHVPTGVANAAGNADMGYMGTTDTTGLGFGLIKPTARPLGTRST